MRANDAAKFVLSSEKGAALAAAGRFAEAVFQMTDFVNGTGLEQYFNNIKSIFYPGFREQAKVGGGGSPHGGLFAGIHGTGRAGPAFGAARFHLNEHETIAVAENEVQLTLRSGEVGGEELEAFPFQGGLGGLLSEGTVLVGDGPLRFPVPELEPRPECHVSERVPAGEPAWERNCADEWGRGRAG